MNSSAGNFASFQGFIQQALKDLNFNQLTEVQAKCIPEFLANKDVIVQSPTGSGKTVGYLIPVLEILLRRKEPWRSWEIGALIIVPTRELAAQVSQVLEKFLASLGAADKSLTEAYQQCNLLRQTCFTSGVKLAKNVADFKENGGNIVIATPGRLAEMLDTKLSGLSLPGHLKSLEVLILDEADRLLEMGFQTSLTSIMSSLPKQRRTGLFSATQAKDVEDIAKAGLRNPCRITLSSASVSHVSRSRVADIDDEACVKASTSDSDDQLNAEIPASLQNFYTIVAAEAKFAALRKFLVRHKTEKTLVFMSTCACVDYFAAFLRPASAKRNGVQFELFAIHRKRSPEQRVKIFQKFLLARHGSALICTDLMARGIDVSDIDWVVQFDLPRSVSLAMSLRREPPLFDSGRFSLPENRFRLESGPMFKHSTFVHRVGRTARVGRSGASLLFLTPSEECYVDFLRRNQRLSLAAYPLRVSHGQAAKMREELRFAASQDRDILEKGTKAFVSYVQHYTKQDCLLVCPLKDLDVVGVAHCFGLMRLPRMPELDGRDLSGFERVALNTADIPYANEQREKGRVATRAKLRSRPAAKTQKKDFSSSYGEPNGRKRKRKSGRTKAHSFEDEDFDDLESDYRLLKKLKKGKISKELFDEKFLG